MNLRKILLAGTLMAFSMTMFSQTHQMQKDDNGMKYLIDGDINLSGFGGVTVDFTSVENDPAVFVGGGGALLINQSVFLGGYGQGLATQHKRHDVSIDEAENIDPVLQFGHGGVWLGYILQPSSVIHLNINTKFGAGELALTESLDEYDMFDSYHKDQVLVLTPSVGINVNILPWFRIAANAGYRLTSGVGDKTYNNSEELIFKSKDYNAPSFSLSFLFGGFN
ncbi:MAG: hypothetical protein K9J27_02940 [Bacteroidales bacterium]|nr:hypothetical protein [Bacteroidales bacterium]MCF8334426.1 hypothetical protein [Bacteroidales bacterium]